MLELVERLISDERRWRRQLRCSVLDTKNTFGLNIWGIPVSCELVVATR